MGIYYRPIEVSNLEISYVRKWGGGQTLFQGINPIFLGLAHSLHEDHKVSQDIVPARYAKNAELIRHFKPKTILETGTWNGGRAIEMALASFENTDTVEYYGFDLFEDEFHVVPQI